MTGAISRKTRNFSGVEEYQPVGEPHRTDPKQPLQRVERRHRIVGAEYAAHPALGEIVAHDADITRVIAVQLRNYLAQRPVDEHEPTARP